MLLTATREEEKRREREKEIKEERWGKRRRKERKKKRRRKKDKRRGKKEIYALLTPRRRIKSFRSRASGRSEWKWCNKDAGIDTCGGKRNHKSQEYGKGASFLILGCTVRLAVVFWRGYSASFQGTLPDQSSNVPLGQIRNQLELLQLSMLQFEQKNPSHNKWRRASAGRLHST